MLLLRPHLSRHGSPHPWHGWLSAKNRRLDQSRLLGRWDRKSRGSHGGSGVSFKYQSDGLGAAALKWQETPRLQRRQRLRLRDFSPRLKMDSKMCRFLVVGVFLLSLKADPTAACSCAPRHPQSAYCNADMVIRGKFVSVSKQHVNISVGEPVWWVRHEIKTTKVYKGPEEMQDVRFLYTPAMESLCGYEHKGPLKGEEYVIAGMMDGNRVMITACSFIQPWSQLSLAQKRGLSLDYSKGCNCTVMSCLSMPCFISSDNQCLWTDGIMSRIWDGLQAKRLACLPRSESSNFCTWQSLSTQGPGSLRKSRLLRQ